ncbi:MAG: MFS transporter [Streptosporangiales bacterium]
MRSGRAAVLAYFAILGLAEGLWVARIPGVKAQLHLTDGVLGASLLVGPAGLVLVMPVAGRLTDWLGSARLGRLAALAIAVLPILLWGAGTMAEVIPALLAFGIAGGILDVAINAQAVRLEEAYGRPLMASFHACYSLAGLTGALLGGLLAGRPATPLGPLAGLGLAGAVVSVLAGRHLAAGPGWPGAPGEEVAGLPPGLPPGPAAAGPPVNGPGKSHAGQQGGPRRAGSSGTLALGLLALCCLISEGAAGNWSGVYLRDDLGTTGWLTAAGFAGFSLAMAGGRLAGDRLVARYGPAGLVRRCALLAAAGLAGALCSRQLAGAVIGFAACGAGLSCTIPQLLSAAGRGDPGQPGMGIARVAGLGYLGLVGGPPLIGGCASLVGLPVALSIPVVLVLGVALFASRLDPRLARPGTGAVSVRPGPGLAERAVSERDPGRPAGSRSR